MPYMVRCTELTADPGEPGERVTPDGESFDTFDSALESLLADTTDDSAPDVDIDSARFAASMDSGFVFDVEHVTGPRYRCTILQADGMSDATIRDDDEGLAYLAHDGGAVPCSRYGRDSSSCAPVALLAARIHASESGEPMTFRLLDSCMSDVVNDSDGIADLLADYATDADLDAIGLDRADAYRLAGRDAPACSVCEQPEGSNDECGRCNLVGEED